MDRKEDKAKTARGVLLGYALMIESAKNTPFPLEAEGLQKVFASASVLKRKLEGLVNALDADLTNARFTEVVTRGRGIAEENDDEEIAGTTIGSVIKSLNQPTEISRRYLNLLKESCFILQNILRDGFTSVYHADFLVRTINELMGPSSVFCKALNQGESEEERKEFNYACEVMANIATKLERQPYVKLRSLVSDMFGTGAVREFEGYPQCEGSPFTKDCNLSTEEGLKAFAGLIGQASSGKINQMVLDYSDGMAQALREVAEQIKDDKVEVKGVAEAIEFLNAYSESGCKTARETKEAVEKKESSFRRTAQGIADAKTRGGNFLPMAGIGQVLNPLRYQNGTRSKDLTKLQEVLRNSYTVYRGWQDVQDRLLTSARMLCGFAKSRVSGVLDKYGGASWFREAMEKVSVNNIVTDPKYNAIIDGSLEELLKAYFAIESENTKMKALPVVLLSKNDEIRGKIEERIKAEEKVSSELREIVHALIKKDFVGEIALALKDAVIPVSDFHKIKSAVKGQETPNKIATTHLLKFCKAVYQNAEKGQIDANLGVILQKKIKDSPDYSNLALRVCEMSGFIPSNIGRLKDNQEYKPKDAQGAYQEVAEELSRENNSDALNLVLSLFEDYKPWKNSYEKEVTKQTEKRKAYETERAVGWQEVLRGACEILCDEKDNCYKSAVYKSAYIANVLVSSLLADAVLKDAGFRDKVKIDSGMGSIAHRLWDKASKGEAISCPPEDAAIELFLEPLIRREYEIAVLKAENILTKNTFEKTKEKSRSAIAFLSSGAFIDFDENTVIESLGEMKEYVALKEGVRGNAPLEEYADAKIKALITETLLPEEKYVQMSTEGFSAERQKELFESLWERVKAGDLEEGFNILDEVGRNNPYFSLIGAGRDYELGEIKEQIIKGNANLESMFKEARWAGGDAQFSERMGGTSDAVKLRMSQRHLDEKRAEVENAKNLSKRFEHIEVEDKRDLLSQLIPSVCRVFCSEIGYLVGKDITDGDKAVQLGLQVSRSKEVVEKGAVAEQRSDLMCVLAEYSQKVLGSGEYSVGFQVHVPSVVCLDSHGEYKATNEQRVSSYAPNILMGVSEGRAKPDAEYYDMLKKAGIEDFSKPDVKTYSQKAQKELFFKTKREKSAGDKLKDGLFAFEQSERYVKAIEASSSVKTYAESLKRTILNS